MKKTKKELKYTIKAEVVLTATGMEMDELLEPLREYGEAEVIDIELIEGKDGV